MYKVPGYEFCLFQNVYLQEASQCCPHNTVDEFGNTYKLTIAYHVRKKSDDQMSSLRNQSTIAVNHKAGKIRS